MGDLASTGALLDWLQAFPGLSRVPHKPADLSDGLIFGEVLSDPNWFGGLKLEKGDNWVIKFNNLKKLYKLLSSYFEEVLEQNSNNLDPMNLTVIAKENDAAEISRLGFLVIAAAVQCEQNQSYIMQIRSLDEDSQHSIMVAIERIMAKFNSDDASGANRGEPADQGSADRLRPSEADEGTTPKALQDKLSRVQGQYEEALAKVGQLQAELKDAQDRLSNAAGSGKSEVLYKAEIDALKRNLEINEAKRHEAEGLLAEEQDLVSTLNRKLDDAVRKAQEASSLRDQLDEMRQVAEKLAKAEATIEKYRKRADEASELRSKLKLLEDENRTLMERSGHVEDEYRRVADSSSLAENFKEELQKLDQARSRLASELETANTRLKNAEDRADKLDELCATQRDQIHTLEVQIRELELGGGLEQEIGDVDEIPDSQLREVLARERKKNSILADENNGLMEKLKKAKVYILNQNEQIKDLREGGAGVAKTDSTLPEVEALQADLQRKQREVDQARADLNEVKAAARREQKLLFTAFYELGLQLQKKTLVGVAPSAASPTWLSTHRQTIDARYRKQ